MTHEEMNEAQVIEISIEEAKRKIALAESAERLIASPEFNDLIEEGFFKEETLRLAGLLSDPTIDETSRECCARDIHGAATLKRYLQKVMMLGNIAYRELQDHEETLDEIRESGNVIVTGASDYEDEE